MITINWFGRYGAGYGDIISPLCYAQNQSEIKEDIVTLIFNWKFLEQKRSKITPDSKVEYIVKAFKFDNIKIVNQYNQLDHKKNLNNDLKSINTLDRMHNVYFPVPRLSIDPKNIVVCSTLNNVESFDVYAGGNCGWKNALSDEQWNNIINQPDTVHIDYRTSIQDAIAALYKCKVFIGYHGSCAWLARLMGVPLVIHTKNKNLTNFCFPWGLEPNKPIDCVEALAKVEHYRTLRDKYIDTARRVQAVHSNKESLLD
jgi:hypothetical protein